MAEIHEIEERVLWLNNLRSSFPPDVSMIPLLKSGLRSDGGRLLTIKFLEEYLRLLKDVTKNQKDTQFYENRGRLKTFNWLLNFIKESVTDSEKREV